MDASLKSALFQINYFFYHSVHQSINSPPQKHHPFLLAKPPLNLQTSQAPILDNPRYILYILIFVTWGPVIWKFGRRYNPSPPPKQKWVCVCTLCLFESEVSKKCLIRGDMTYTCPSGWSKCSFVKQRCHFIEAKSPSPKTILI